MSLWYQLRLAMPSRFEELELVDSLMEALLGHVGCDQDERSNLALSVREALANAVLHGNRLAADKSVSLEVTLEMTLDAGELRIQVSDEGAGFDPDAVPDPLAPENLLKPTGRGILLMRNFMDEVSFEFPNSGGTLVFMRKSLAARTPGP